MTPRPPSKTAQDTRARIERVALDLFLRQGYATTSMRELAVKVGVSSAALYYHFADKDSLLRAVVAPLIEGGEEFLAALRQRRGRDRAQVALEGYYDLIVSHQALYRFVTTDPSVRAHPELGPRLSEQEEELLDVLAGPRAARKARLRAAASVGALRRALRLTGIDPVRDRPVILAAAFDALGSLPPGKAGAGD